MKSGLLSLFITIGLFQTTPAKANQEVGIQYPDHNPTDWSDGRGSEGEHYGGPGYNASTKKEKEEDPYEKCVKKCNEKYEKDLAKGAAGSSVAAEAARKKQEVCIMGCAAKYD